MHGFHNKNVIITGASSGIGAAFAQRFALSGSHLYLYGTDPQKLERVQLQLENNMNSSIHTFCVNFISASEIIESIQTIQSLSKSIDILIHCAGRIEIESIFDLNMDALDQMYHINFRAPVLITKLLLHDLRKSRGEIVFMNTSLSHQGGKENLSAYSSTKMALKSFAESLREEENQHGIRVLNVYPGRTATPMQQTIYGIEDKKYVPEVLLQPIDIVDAVMSALSLHKTAEITDIFVRPFVKSSP